MKAQLTAHPFLQIKNDTTRRTERFMKTHSLIQINHALAKYGATGKDIALFKQLIAQETEGFFGYQAGSSTVRLFQDVLSIIVKDILQIPIKDDFVFLRVPGDPTFRFESGKDFIEQEKWRLSQPGQDNQPAIRQHILSLNTALYQSYDAPWDLTPRYYPSYPHHELLFDDKASNFPQLRLIAGNRSTLNPFSTLSIKRYDNMTDQERQKYESFLRTLLEELSFDPEKVADMRKNLLEQWTN